MGFGKGREGRGAYTFRKCLSLPYEYDVALDEICVERLECREQEIAMSRASSVNIQIQPKCAGNKRLGGKGGATHTINPTHTTGFAFSNSTFHPYSPVNTATPTPAQPSASRTSVCRYCCLNRSGLDRNCPMTTKQKQETKNSEHRSETKSQEYRSQSTNQGKRGGESIIRLRPGNL